MTSNESVPGDSSYLGAVREEVSEMEGAADGGAYDRDGNWAGNGVGDGRSIEEQQLDMLRRKYEEEGEYLEAQRTVLAMKKLQIQEGNRRREEMERVYERYRAEVCQHQEEEKRILVEEWNQKHEEFLVALEMEKRAMAERHKIDIRQVRDHFYAEASTRRIRYSKDVLNTQSVLDRMVKSKQYTQAQDLKKELDRKRKQEEDRFEREKEVKFVKVMNLTKKRLEQEMNALQARHRRELAEFEKDKNESLMQMARVHENYLRQLEAQQRLEMSKANNYLSKQSSVLLASPGKMTIDMRHFEVQDPSGSHLSPAFQPSPS